MVDKGRLDFTLIRSESGELGEVITQHAVEDLPLMAATLPSWCTWYPASPLDSRVKTYPARALSIPGAGANFNALGSQEGANGWLVDRIVDNEIHI